MTGMSCKYVNVKIFIEKEKKMEKLQELRVDRVTPEQAGILE